jgi:hypothetical protein
MNPFPVFPQVHLREARPEDAKLLRYWDTQPHLLAATTDDWHSHLPLWNVYGSCCHTQIAA